MDFTALVEELGIDKLPEDQQRSILATCIKTVHLNVGLRLQQILTPEQQQQLSQIAEEKGEDEAIMEIAKMYPEVGALYQEEVDKLKESMKYLLTPSDKPEQQ